MANYHSRWIVVAVLAFGSARAAAGPAAQPFTLGKYVPQDCWMFVHGVHDPAREFIDAHWARVFTEVKKSGIDAELKKLIVGSLEDVERAQFEQAWDKAMQLVQGVRWGDLVAKETAFAERLGSITPDLIVLCRSSENSVAGNVQGLKAIMEALASMGEGVAVTESSVHGLGVWTLKAEGVPMSLHVFNKGDIVGIVVGPKALEDVTALMAGEKGVTALVDTPRFKQAAAELPPPQNVVTFFDLQLLIRNLNQMFTTIFEQEAAENKSHEEHAQRVRRVLLKVLDHFDFFDYGMAVGRTEGLRETTVSTMRLRPEAMDKPLCRIFTVQKPFEKFDRYVPKEATGFSVSSFADLRGIYNLILDFLRTEIPETEVKLAQWAEFQKEVGFDLEADLFSWWGGELVSVSLPPAVKGPFASGDFVIFIRVKDAKLAAAKVSAGLDRLAGFLREHEQTLMLADVSDVRAEGFRSVTHPLLAMQGVKFIVGVTDDHLVIGNSAAAINACLATAAGQAPSILESERFRKEGLVPKGPVCSASFSDLSNFGQELGSVFFMMGLVGTMIPEEPETRPIKAMIGILGRLSPAIAQIDFYSSKASMCTFDGRRWTTQDVMNYKPAPASTTRPSAGTAP
ncbi:MAG: hypothetical protein V2A79_14305 [Planctomycetota bacterium]